MTRDEMKQYEVTPTVEWDQALFKGGDGYDVMDTVCAYGWHPIADWGEHGWDLGNWPLVVVFRRRLMGEQWQIAEYCEGDVTQYTCPTQELRNQVIDRIALFYWCHENRSWVRGLSADVEPIPAHLCSPSTLARVDAAPEYVEEEGD
jgi:hypothetical protein